MSTKRHRFYQGQPVKRMRRDGDMLILTFVSGVAGERGRQLKITQDDWAAHGEWREISVDCTNEELRKLVRNPQ